MNERNIFAEDYIDDSGTERNEQQRSVLKEFLHAPTSEDAMMTYGSSKPRRVVIRGKIISDEG